MIPGPYVTTGRRIVAAVIDGALTSVPVLVLHPIAMVLATKGSNGAALALFAVEGLAAAALGVGVLLAQGTKGASPGDRLMGQRTVDATTGLPLGFWRALLRQVIVGAGSMVCGVGAWLVLLSPAWDGNRRWQGWHDKIAGSVVLPGLPVAPVRTFSPPAPGAHGYPPPPAAAPVTLVGGITTIGGAAAPGPGAAPGIPGVQLGAAGAVPAGPIAQVPGFARSADPAAPASSSAAGGQVAPVGPAAAGMAPPPAPPAPPAPPSVGAAVPPPGPAVGQQPPSLPPLPPGIDQLVPPAPQPPAPPAPAPAAHEPDLAIESTVLSPRAAGPSQVRWVLTGADRRRIPVTGPTYLGRAPGPAGSGRELVTLDDPGRSVSKTHAELGIDANGLWVLDRGSSNGTVILGLDGVPIIVDSTQPQWLKVGEILRLGDVALEVGREAT